MVLFGTVSIGPAHSYIDSAIVPPCQPSKEMVTFNNQPDALIIQIYSVIKLYMFRASSLPIIRSSLLYIRRW